MIRLLLRLGALALLAGAFAALVVDCARTLADSHLVLTSLNEALAHIAPPASGAEEPAGAQGLFANILRGIGAAPASLALASMGALLMRVTRRRAAR